MRKPRSTSGGPRSRLALRLSSFALAGCLVVAALAPARAQLSEDPSCRPAPIFMPAQVRTTTAGELSRNASQTAAPAAPQSQAGPPLLLKGQVTYLVPRGTPIQLKLATVPTTGLRLADRDLDGNLHPAQLGQEITAKTTEDLYVDANKVIPIGTVFHGRVSKILPPRRAGRPGSLVLSFDRFQTPDGRTFAFHAEADNFKESTWKSKARGAGRVAAHAAGGAIVGALFAYQLFGLNGTVAMEGYNVAGGAALGALGGTAYALMKRGSHAVLEPGDDLNMAIDTDLLMPAAVEPTPKAPPSLVEGLEIDIEKTKVIKDGLGSYMMRVDAVITNESEQRLNSLDLFFEDDNGRQHSVTAGPDYDSEMIFHVERQSIKRVRFYFSIEYPKLKGRLVWYAPRTHKQLVSQRIP